MRNKRNSTQRRVVTYSDTRGNKLNICPRHEVEREGNWPCNPRSGEEYATILHSAHYAHCDLCAHEMRFADYPVVDEYDRRLRALDLWESYSLHKKIQACGAAGESIFAARRDAPPDKVYELCRSEVLDGPALRGPIMWQ